MRHVMKAPRSFQAMCELLGLAWAPVEAGKFSEDVHYIKAKYLQRPFNGERGYCLMVRKSPRECMRLLHYPHQL